MNRYKPEYRTPPPSVFPPSLQPPSPRSACSADYPLSCVSSPLLPLLLLIHHVPACGEQPPRASNRYLTYDRKEREGVRDGGIVN